MELLRWVPPSTDYMEAGLAKDGSRGGRAGMAGGAAGQGRGPGDAPSRALRVEGSCDARAGPLWAHTKSGLQIEPSNWIVSSNHLERTSNQ